MQHLLMRGEPVKNIRVLDLTPPTREDVKAAGVAYIRTDVTDAASVVSAVESPWPDGSHMLPLTVFHCAAYINPAERKALFLSRYIQVNIEGTRNVVEAAQKAGASVFIATTSAAVGSIRPHYFPWPWRRLGRGVVQSLGNADPPHGYDAPLEAYPSCYSWSKAQMERLVLNANSATFLTGAIRPGYAVIGPGPELKSNILLGYLKDRGSPTWLFNTVQSYVNAQNVSVGHLAFEAALLRGDTVAGKAYCVADPNPPVRGANIYRALETLAHPSTPISFPHIPFLPLLGVAYLVELYTVIRKLYAPFLPPVTGDLAVLQPGVLQVCTFHLAVSDQRARGEIGYLAPISTLQGCALLVLAWNESIEKRA